MSKFVQFMDRMSRESGQVALCEAIKRGYMIMVEASDRATTALNYSREQARKKGSTGTKGRLPLKE